MTDRIKLTIKKHGRPTCIKAITEHESGDGARTVGERYGYSGRDALIWGDRLIDSGRYLVEKIFGNNN